jgi:hypothetical protein
MDWCHSMSFCKICWITILLLSGNALAADIPFIFDGTNLNPINDMPQLNALVDNNFDQRVEGNHDLVMATARILAAKHPGDHTIEQISEIFDFMRYGNPIERGWCYVSDPTTFEYYAYANQSLAEGQMVGCSGLGDCDDFAIAMASLIEAIGCNARIVAGYNNNKGHAYAEVYLGKKNTNDFDAVLGSVYDKYGKDIYVHINRSTDDVWLNLDWNEDLYGLSYPGGPFFRANRNSVAWTSRASILEGLRKAPPQLAETVRIIDPQNDDRVPLNYEIKGSSIATGASGLKAYALIWPVEANGPWWVQETQTEPTGKWTAKAYFGRQDDIGNTFTIIAILTDQELRTGTTYSMLPPNWGKSNEVRVYRT